MLSALIDILLNLLCTAGMTLVAVGVGRILLCRPHTRIGASLEWAVFSAGLGFGALGYAVFFLAVFQVLSPKTLSVLIGLASVLALGGWLAVPCSVTRVDKKGGGGAGSLWNRLLLALLSFFLLMGLVLALTPVTGKDALIYHLAVPKLFLEHGGFYFIEGNVFAHYPLGGEMLYTLALGLFGEVSAKGLHFIMACAVLTGMWQFSRQHVSGSSLWPVGLLVFYTIPTVFMLSHVAYNDLTVTLFTFLAVYALVNWFARKNRPWLIWCGVFTGLALSTKYTALFLPFLGCLGILWHCRRESRSGGQALGFLVLYLGFAAVVGCPFYLKNWAMTGNPFYPFLYGLFGGKGWDPDQARLYDLFVRSLGMGRGLWDYLLLPWNLSVHAKMHSPQFDGVLGPIFLLTLPFALGMKRVAPAAKVGLVYAFFAFLFWASAAQQMRYLVPVFPFLAVMAAYVVSYYRPKRFLFGLLVVFVAGSVTVNGYHGIKHFLKVRPLGVVLGTEKRDAFLSRTLPAYDVFEYVNRELPEETRVFLIYMKNHGYLCDRPFYSDSMFESYTIQKILSHSQSPKDVYDTLKGRGFTHILYDENYVFGGLSTFSPREKKLFSEFQNDYLSLIKRNKSRYYLFGLK